MGRVRAQIHVRGRRRWTRFDSGAENTYVLPEVASGCPVTRVDKRHVRLGGRTHQVDRSLILPARAEGKPADVEAYIIDEIGYDRKAKRPFEVLFGALAMQKWGIVLRMRPERLDMSGYSKEFVEFLEC